MEKNREKRLAMLNHEETKKIENEKLVAIEK